MRTLSLNLDLCDAEILRDAVARQLGLQPIPTEPTLIDPHTQSLRATLNELNRMIDRPSPRQRMALRTGRQDVAIQLRRVH